MNFAIRLMSITPTASRIAACSRATTRATAGRAKSITGPPGTAPAPASSAPAAPGPANHSANSQPAETPKCAPAAASRSCSTDRRTFRALRGCHDGQTASPNSTPSCSTVRSARKRRDVSCSAVRSSATGVTSTGGTPSTIHCAIIDPTPPPDRMPSEFSPAATQYPSSSGAGPSSGRTSEVNDSGPQKNVRTPASARHGIRSIARARYGSIRSQSGGSFPNENPAGTPSSDHGAPTGSNSPTSIPSPSGR